MARIEEDNAGFEYEGTVVYLEIDMFGEGVEGCYANKGGSGSGVDEHAGSAEGAGFDSIAGRSLVCVEDRHGVTENAAIVDVQGP